MVRQIAQAGIAAFILLAISYTGTASAHGTVEMEDDSCMRRIGENMIHLSVYQPQVDVEGHYCTDIPQAGNAVLVIDLVDPALREIPIGIKVVRGSNEEDGDIIANMRPTLYQDGVINTQKMLEQGQHVLVVTADGLPPLTYKYNLRVEMINYAEVFRASIGPVVGILLTTILGYKILRSRRFKGWLASKSGKQTDDNDTSGGKTSRNKTAGSKTNSSSKASNNDAGSAKASIDKISTDKTNSNEASEDKATGSKTTGTNKTSK